MRGRDPGVRWSVKDGVARVTLDRPRHGNRIDEFTAAALCDAAQALEMDDDVTVVVLSAAGRAFCLGVEDSGDWQRRHDWVAAVGSLTRPVVAVVQGDAVAEGCELALACDLRIVARGAKFSLPQISQGRLPSHGGTQRLPRIVGRTRAMEILLSGRAVPWREALSIGLASRAVPRDDLSAVADREVDQLRHKGAIALRLGKEAVLRGMEMTLEQGVRFEQDLYVLLQTTADRREGVAAALEKRKPVFRGK